MRHRPAGDEVMRQRLIRLAGRAGEHWRAERRLTQSWILTTAALLLVIAALAVAAWSFTASLIAVAACVFAAGMAAGALAALVIASWRLRDKDSTRRPR